MGHAAWPAIGAFHVDWLLALATPEHLVSLLTLSALEIVLGIDNLIFIAIVANRLPAAQRSSARRGGLIGALIMRLGLLAAISWIMGLTRPVVEAYGWSFYWRDIILIAGGIFLVYKGTGEIHARLEGEEEHSGVRGGGSPTFLATILQIMLLDIVFSIDSVITAVGMANELWVMMTAVIFAVLIMLIAAGPVAAFVNRHPTVKMLALSFLLLIGMTLIADGFGAHISKGYIYAAISFSMAVETLNQIAGRRRRRSSLQAVRPPAAGEP
jgi:predicted tellurium resistance membrane protein TerC